MILGILLSFCIRVTRLFIRYYPANYLLFMSWIQFFHDFWRELDVCRSILLVWLIGTVLFSVVVPALKLLFFLPVKRKERKALLRYCNKNLKSGCFLDHATNEYVLPESSICRDKDMSFRCGNVIMDALPGLNAPVQSVKRLSIPSCYGVSFFSHNRLQTVEDDEAHWFRIKLYPSDLITRGALKEWARLNPELMGKVTQASELDERCPFVTSIRLAVNVYYRHLGRTLILFSDRNSFFFETEITPELFPEKEKDDKDNFASRLCSVFNAAMASAQLQPVDHVSYREIGFDAEENALYIIGQQPVKYSRKVIRKYRHKPTCYSFRLLTDLFEKNRKPLSLFEYSFINLRSWVYKEQRVNKEK